MVVLKTIAIIQLHFLQARPLNQKELALRKKQSSLINTDREVFGM